MSDIDLYEKSAGSYEELQLKRPDYFLAQKAFNDLVDLHLSNHLNLEVADFCSGTGNNTLNLAKNFGIKKATLIDINNEFLNLAKKSELKTIVDEMITIGSDILKVTFDSKNDVVISMFAYHHVKDEDKAKYIEVVKDALKIGGILLLGEIYMPDKETTLAYYEDLIKSIPSSVRTPELETFLRQTASSDHFEYKVSQEFAYQQLKEAGFELLDSFPVWPKDRTSSKGIGMFVEAWKLIKIN